MTRVRIDLFLSLDGYAATAEPTPDSPMGEDWGRLTAAYAETRTFRKMVFGDTSGTGTTGIDDSYAAAFFEGVGRGDVRPAFLPRRPGLDGLVG